MRTIDRRLRSRHFIASAFFALAVLANGSVAIPEQPAPVNPAAQPNAPPIYLPGPSPDGATRMTTQDLTAHIQRLKADNERKIKSLRQVATKLEISANELEEIEAYESADKLRENAKSLRQQARELSSQTSTLGVPTY